MTREIERHYVRVTVVAPDPERLAEKRRQPPIFSAFLLPKGAPTCGFGELSAIRSASLTFHSHAL